jgi:predicted nucleic-acid-binding protein
VITVDTSILIRHIMQDDAVQSPLASELLENRLTASDPGLVTAVALHEMAWVLRSIYRRSADDVALVVRELLDAPNLVVEHADAVVSALTYPAGLADALIHHIGSALGAAKTLTFDKKFARLDGVALLDA